MNSVNYYFLGVSKKTGEVEGNVDDTYIELYGAGSFELDDGDTTSPCVIINKAGNILKLHAQKTQQCINSPYLRYTTTRRKALRLSTSGIPPMSRWLSPKS